MADTKMIRGTVKWFDPVKGYGFIQGEDGTDYFVHQDEIVSGRLFKGYKASDKVEFEPSKRDKGLAAANVHIRNKDARIEEEAANES